MLNQVVEATTRGWEKDRVKKQLKQKLRHSLENFEYSNLEIEFKDTARPSGLIHLQGKGAQDEGLPLDLSIRFKTDKL